MICFFTASGQRSIDVFLLRLLDEVKGILIILHRFLSHYYVNDLSYVNMVIFVEASALAEKINHIICVNRSNRMAKLTEAAQRS